MDDMGAARLNRKAALWLLAKTESGCWPQHLGEQPNKSSIWDGRKYDTPPYVPVPMLDRTGLMATAIINHISHTVGEVQEPKDLSNNYLSSPRRSDVEMGVFTKSHGRTIIGLPCLEGTWAVPLALWSKERPTRLHGFKASMA